MFGNKKIQKLQKQINELEKRIWLLENPIKFKNGDKVYYKNGNEIFFNELIVVGHQIDTKYFMEFSYKDWICKVFNTKENELQFIFQSDLILTKDVEQTNNTTSARD